ncbi:hypothetical protein F6X39_31805 [Paraburkholderia sp. UCT2]|nr:hypothetical protein [Paraburkholderia sp. UCT2]
MADARADPPLVQSLLRRISRGDRREFSAGSARLRYRGPVHANNGLALAARRAERKDCDAANTRRIRKEHDAAIGPSGGQPLEGFFKTGERAFPPVLRRRSSLVWLGQTALLSPCTTRGKARSQARY